ncbi:MAG: class I SAM-dependent methyltransferase, partial [Rhodanobacter sp.]
NIHVVGIDVVPGLIAQAQQAGGGDFRVTSYEEIAIGGLELSADVVACNFSLLGKESVEGIFNAIRSLLRPGGAFIVQTLHPIIAGGDAPYEDGWRPGSWAGFSPDFVEPAPWYFRTLESWVKLFATNDLTLLEVRDPLHPVTGKPASVLFIAEASGH